MLNISKKSKPNILGFALVLPSLILVLSIIGYPLINAIYISFTDKAIGTSGKFIGLKNYYYLLTNNLFWKAFVNTIVFAISAVICKSILGFVLALVLDEVKPFQNITKSLLLIPWIIPTVITALIWMWMYYDLFGVINYILISLKIIKEPISWLGSSKYALSCLIFVNVWREIPFFGLCILAGINNIPKNIINSSKIDGANYFNRLKLIIIPNIKYVMITVISLSMIWTMGEFQIVHIMTRGGPANATQIFSTLIYEFGFRSFDVAKAMTISIIYLPLLIQLIFILKSTTKLTQDNIN